MLEILIVDDVREELMLAERVIRHCKILNPVHVISSAEDCLCYFEKNQRDEPYLLFLDMMMPTSGLALLQTLNARQLQGESIIVMLSGITDIKVIQQGYQLGAKTFLVKPITPEDMVSLLGSLNGKIRIEEGPGGHVLHWISTPESQQSNDTQFIRRPGGVVTVAV